MAIGIGAVEDTLTQEAIGKGPVPDALMFGAAGLMARVAMHGIEGIGQNNS
jgi:hypothetical protein